MAGGALVGGGVVWAVLRFGVPVFLTDETHSARPVLEALSWIAGIGGLVVAVVALVVALRQGRDRAAAREVAPSAASQTATGGSGSGTTTGVHIGWVGGLSEPSGADGAVGHAASAVPTKGAPAVSVTGNVTATGGTAIGAMHGGTVVQGDLVVGGPSVPAMESIPATPGLDRIPAGSELFVGRSGELARLDAAVAGSGRAVVVAVHGLGGVGKSTLAARFAHLHADRYTLVWWITADSVTAIDTGLADLATTLAPRTADLPLEQRTDLGMRWLATHDGWLLVLDNLTTPADAAGLFERVRTGTIVITSRQRTGWRGVDTIPLDVLSVEEAVELLARIVRAEWPEADLTDADRLCEELGWLPLAVEQAGAYIAQTRITPAAYLGLLKRYPARMFTATAEGGDAQRTMARVWHVTLDKLADTPLAGELLRQLAWYAPDAIPRHLVDPGDSPGFGEALGRLAAYSMITLTTDTITIHRLVQAVSRTPDPEDRHRQPRDIANAVHAATSTLTHALDGHDPQSPASWPRYHTLLLHAHALFDYTDPAADTDLTCELLLHIGRFLRNQAAITKALDLLTRNRDSALRLHGPDDPDTLISRVELASAYTASGDLRRAVELHEAVLTDCERALGPDHRDTIASRMNLAEAYLASGFLNRTVPLCEAVLTDCERVLGPDHRNTLIARHNLAHAYLMAGDTSRAIPLHEAVLADCERVLGEDAPDTFRSRNNLAHAYLAAGDVGRAIPVFRSTLAEQERALGDEHPDTLRSRSDLAKAYQAAGDLNHAIPLSEATLADQERVLGADHPDTLTSRNNLAHAYQTAGDLDRAIPLYDATLADRERVLGPDHPFTLTSRTNLALAYLTIRKLERAIPLYEAALADQQRVLGDDHPDTLRSRNDVASAYHFNGETARAIPLFEATLADRERVLGPDHPDTLRSRANLANVHRAGGDLNRALLLLETALADQERVLGTDHPDTLRSRVDLAVTYCKVPDLARAIPLMRSTLADRERVLGADHPDTLTSRVGLAFAYHADGDHGRAIPLLEDAVANQQRLLSGDHPDTLISRATLATAHHAAGNLDRAIPLYKTTLADSERVLGHTHPLTERLRVGLRTAEGK